MSDPEDARAKLTAFVGTLAKIAVETKSAEIGLKKKQLISLTKDEQAALRRLADQLSGAVEEVVKVIAQHPQSDWQEHALIELRNAISAAFMIGRCAMKNPNLERIEREVTEASVAHARLKRAETSTSTDSAIIECVNSLWNKAPKLRGKAKPTAEEICESGVLSKLKIGPAALEKRIGTLKKSGLLASRP